MSITLDEIMKAGKLQQGFWRWFDKLPVSTRAPMRAVSGINGEIVFKPRGFLDPLSDAEFDAALVRIDEVFQREARDPRRL